MKLFWILLFFVIYFLGLFFIYFSFPEKTFSEEGTVNFYSCVKYDCVQIFLDLVNSSDEIECAFYDLNEPRLLNYFENNDEHLLLYGPNNKYNLGTSINIVGLMHHKFCVFDKQLTLTGSWNPTKRGTEKNDNYIVLIKSNFISNNFLTEYLRLKKGEKKGAQGISVNLSGTEIQTCFSPNNHCGKNILDKLSLAKKSIYFLAFSFTDKEIANTILNLTKLVDVTVLFEKTRITTFSTYYLLKNTSVKVLMDGNPYTMHEKLILIDNKTVILGSYNPSISADERNDENLLTLSNLNSDFLQDIYAEIVRVVKVAK